MLLWKPDEVIDDSSLMQLDVDLGFEGMKEEIGNLEKCGAGRVIGQAEVDALKRKHPLMRVIPSRWVSAYKSESRVRVRIVAKDLNKELVHESWEFRAQHQALRACISFSPLLPNVLFD